MKVEIPKVETSKEETTRVATSKGETPKEEIRRVDGIGGTMEELSILILTVYGPMQCLGLT